MYSIENFVYAGFIFILPIILFLRINLRDEVFEKWSVKKIRWFFFLCVLCPFFALAIPDEKIFYFRKKLLKISYLSFTVIHCSVLIFFLWLNSASVEKHGADAYYAVQIYIKSGGGFPILIGLILLLLAAPVILLYFNNKKTDKEIEEKSEYCKKHVEYIEERCWYRWHEKEELPDYFQKQYDNYKENIDLKPLREKITSVYFLFSSYAPICAFLSYILISLCSFNEFGDFYQIELFCWFFGGLIALIAFVVEFIYFLRQLFKWKTDL